MARLALGMAVIMLAVSAAAQTYIAAPQLGRNKLGYGYFTATHSFSEFPCVQGVASAATAGNTAWTWVEASSYRELKEKVKSKFHADLKYDAFSADGSYLGITDSESSSYGFTVIGKTSVTTTGDGYNGVPQFSDFAASHLGTAKFSQVCGDSYVKATFMGGAIYIIGQIATHDSTVTKNFSHNVKAAVQGEFTGSAAAEAESYFHAVKKDYGATIRVERSGPITSLQTSAVNADSAKGVIKQFADLHSYSGGKFLEELANATNRVPIQYEMGSYTVLAGWKGIPETDEWAESAYATLDAMSQYVADLRTLRSGYGFFGPIDSLKLRTEINTWVASGEALSRQIERCERGKTGCKLDEIKKVKAPRPAPLPGKKFYATAAAGPNYINLGAVTNVVAIDGTEGYANPLSVRVSGEWAWHYPGDDRPEKMCGNPLGESLWLISKDQKFILGVPDGRAVAEKITGKTVIATRNAEGFAAQDDDFVMLNWPPARRLSLSLDFPNGFGHNVDCRLDVPQVQIWESDPRINSNESVIAVAEKSGNDR